MKPAPFEYVAAGSAGEAVEALGRFGDVMKLKLAFLAVLAAGAVGGVVLADTGKAPAGCAVTAFACACMALAGVVLVVTDRKFVRAALVQAVPPLVAVIAIALQA